MDPAQVTKTAAGLYFGLVLAAAYYTLRINNLVELDKLSFRDVAVMGCMAALPLLSAWIGLRLARGNGAGWLLAIGQTIALLIFAVTFGIVFNSVEPMAPLLLFLVSLWLAAGLAVLLLLVWLVGRR